MREREREREEYIFVCVCVCVCVVPSYTGSAQRKQRGGNSFNCLDWSLCASLMRLEEGSENSACE